MLVREETQLGLWWLAKDCSPTGGMLKPSTSMPCMSKAANSLVRALLYRSFSLLRLASAKQAGTVGRSCFPGIVREGILFSSNQSLSALPPPQVHSTQY